MTRIVACQLVGLLVACVSIQAADYTWIGASGGNWNNGANWSPGLPPDSSTTNLIFPNTFSGTSNNDFGAARDIGTITLEGDCTLTGNSIDIFGSIVTDAAATGTKTISFNMVLQTGAHTISVVAGRLDLNGVLSGAGSVVVNGAGTLRYGNTAANSYSGGTTVNDGVLELNANGVNAIPGGGALTVGDGTDSGTVRHLRSDQIDDASDVTVRAGGTLNLNGFNDRLNDLLTMSGGSITTGGGTLTLDDNLTYDAAIGATQALISGNLNLLNANRTLTINDGPDAIDLRITANISQSAEINKNGSGTLLLSGSNGAYSGITRLNNGALLLGSNNAIGSGLLDVNGTATSLAADGGARTLANATDFDNATCTIGGTDALSITGACRIAGTSTLVLSNTASTTLGGMASMEGNLTLNGTGGLSFGAMNFTGTRTITVNTSGTVAVNGNVTKNGNDEDLNKDGTGGLTFSGTTTIDQINLNAGTIRLAGGGALGGGDGNDGKIVMADGTILILDNSTTANANRLVNNAASTVTFNGTCTLRLLGHTATAIEEALYAVGGATSNVQLDIVPSNNVNTALRFTDYYRNANAFIDFLDAEPAALPSRVFINAVNLNNYAGSQQVGDDDDIYYARINGSSPVHQETANGLIPGWPTNGLMGEFYDTIALTDLKFVRVEDTAVSVATGLVTVPGGDPVIPTTAGIGYYYTGTAPDRSMGTNYFTVRYTGSIVPQFSEAYTFYLTRDDGARLWIDDVLVIDAWDTSNATTAQSAPITLTANQKHNIRIEHFEWVGETELRLEWSSASVARQFIPKTRMYPSYVVVTPLTGLVTTEAGGQDSFTVRLALQPEADVTIPISSTNAGEGAVSAAQVVFSSDSGAPNAWNIPQTITVTGQDDALSDGSVSYSIILGAATSTDTRYQDFNPPDVQAVNMDNETPGITVTPRNLTVTEAAGAGNTSTFSIVLNSPPAANKFVAVRVQSSNTAEGTVEPAEIRFSTADWDISQTVTVTGVDDSIDDENKTFTIYTFAASSDDLTYNRVNAADVTVTNIDDDSIGVVISAISGPTTENGGTATFTVRLATQPAWNMEMPLRLSATPAPNITATTEARIDVPNVVFTPLNWDVPQTVTLQGLDDSTADGTVSYYVITDPLRTPGGGARTDTAYADLDPQDLVAMNTDNETAAIIVSPTAGLVTTESGGTASFNVSLSTPPSGNVTINFNSSNTAEGTVSTSSYTFTASNWNLPFRVTMTGVNDTPAVRDGDIAYTVVTSVAAGSAGAFAALDPDDVSVTNNDNDTAGFVVTPTTGLQTDEGGLMTNVNFTVRLSSQPSSQVTIPVSSSDATEGNASVASLVFDSTNWNVNQTVTVTGADDADTGNETYTIILSPATSLDTNFDGQDPDDVSVLSVDNETAQVVITPTGTSTASGITTSEPNTTATFRVVLSRNPATAGAEVKVEFESFPNETEGKVTAGQALSFYENSSGSNPKWNQIQTVTVTGQDDVAVDGAQNYQIRVKLISGGDAQYNALPRPPLTVYGTNLDNETALPPGTPGVTITTPTGGVFTSEPNAQTQFSVVLNSEPTANVDVEFSVLTGSGEVEIISPGGLKLTFTAANWDVPQFVTLRGKDDAVLDGNQAFTIEIKPLNSTDSRYQGINPADVAGINRDDDRPAINVSAASGNTTEAGGIATFQISLALAPTSAVTIPVATNNSAEGTLSVTSVTFNAGSTGPIAITVTGINDFQDDGDKTYAIVTGLAVSTDTRYNGIDPADPAFTNTDDDAVGIIVTPATAPGGPRLKTTEAGNSNTASFTIKLGSQPEADVYFPIASGDTTEGTIAESTITFTPDNWNVEQSVVITGVDDGASDGNQDYSIVTGVANSIDDSYSNINPDDVYVTNYEGGVFVSPLYGLQTSETAPGAPQTFTVRLLTTPTAPVTIGISVSNASEGQVSAASLTFTDMTPQTVTVTGVDDAIADCAEPYTVILSPDTTTADVVYNGLDPDDVSVTNLDDESTVTINNVSVTEGNPPDTVNAVFTISKSTACGHPIRITYRTQNSDAMAPGDYSTVAALAVIPANATSVQVSIPITVDTTAETDEKFFVNLITADLALISDAQGEGTIVDDDNPLLPVVSVTASDAAASEPGTDSGTFTFSRTGSTASALTVNFTVSGGAIEGTDYSAIGTSIQILAGSPSATITITPLADTLIEGTETATVTLDTSVNYNIDTNAMAASVTIADLPTISILATDGSAAEPGSTGTLTVSRTGSTAADLTVTFSVSGTATEGADYTAIGTSVIILAGSASATITVAPLADTDIEASESAIVTLSGASNTTYNIDPVDNAGTVTIADLPTISISATDATASEPGTDTGTITVARTGSTGADLTVNFTVSGTATENSDYTAIGTSIVIPAGSSSAQIVITPLPDTTIDAGETAIVSLSGASSTTYNSDPVNTSGTVTINDLPTVSISATDGSAAEPGADTGTFTVTRTGSTAADLTVSFVVSGTAAELSDYSAIGVSVLIPAGSASAAVTVTPLADTDLEGSEIVTITLSGAGSSTYNIDPVDNADSATIADLPAVSIAATDAGASEPGTDTGTFTVTRSGSTAADLTVDFVVSGTATGADYTAIGTSVLIPTGSATATITITPQADTLTEGSETVIVTLSGASSTTYNIDPAGDDDTATIADLPTISIVASDSTADEQGPDPGTFTISRTGSTSGALTVDFTVSGSATEVGDYGAVGTSVTIADGAASAAITITPVNDALVEGTEDAVLTLAGASSTTYNISAISGMATVFISELPTVSISATDDSATEPGTNTGTFKVTRTGSTASALAVTFSVSGTAAEGTDYSAIGTSINIPISAASATITITPLPDTSIESAEDVVVTLTGSGPTYNVDAANSVDTVTIADLPTVSIVATDDGAAESGTNTGTFTVTRTGSTTADLTVNFGVSGTASEGADYSAIGTSVLILAGSTTATVTITPLADTTIEATETAIITLSGASDTTYNINAGSNAATVNIDDLPTLSIVATDGSASEPGTNTGTFTVTRTGSTAADLTVSFNVSGTAIQGTDYTTIGSGVTILAGSATATVTITPLADTAIEAAETAIVTLSGASDSTYNIDGTNGAATVSIDDLPTISIVATDGSASEPGTNTGTFTVTRTGSTTADLTVSFGVSGTATEGTDYTAIGTSVTILAGSATATVTITPLADTAIEATETAIVTLSGASDSTYNIDGTNGAATVSIDDLPTISIVATDGSAAERGLDTGTFTVTRTGSTAADLTVNFGVSGTTTEGTDYTAIGTSVTILAGSATATVTITPLADTAIEATETAIVTLTGASDSTYNIDGTNGAATVSVDDLPTISIIATDDSASEPGTDIGTFTVSRTGSTAADLTVNLGVSGTATSGSDYTALSGTVTILAGNSSATLNVSPLDDAVFEVTETVIVSITADPGFNVDTAAGSATVNIASEEAQPSISIDNVTAAEGDSGTTVFDFTVTLSGPSSQAISVQYDANDGTATIADLDFAAASSTLNFSPGEVSKTVSINVNGDGKVEGNETFTVPLSNPSNVTLGTSTGTGTITNDDQAPAITAVTSTTADGIYGAGASINVTVTFSEPVTLTGGNLVIVLNSGGSVPIAPFGPAATASGTYVVTAGQTSSDLNSLSPLNVTGALQDGLGNAVTLTIPPGQSLASSSQIVIDAVAPGATSVDLTDSSDSGISNTDNITSVTSPVFAGTAEAGSTVNLFDGEVLIGTATADTNGTWILTIAALTDGVHNISATVTDSGGNASPSSTALAISIDSTVPSSSSPPDLLASSDTGLSDTDDITSDNTPTIIGTAEAGSTVSLFDGGTLIGSATADTSGTWSITTSILADSIHTLTAAVTDPAGNAAPVSGGLTIMVDATGPEITSPLSSSAVQIVTGQAIQLNVGASDTTALIYSWDAGNGLIDSTSSGDWSATFTVPGTYLLSVTVTDMGGSSVTSTITVVVGAAVTDFCDVANAADLRVQQLMAKRKFPSSLSKDSLKLKALIMLNDGFQLAGQEISWDIGGIAHTLTFDAKGRSPKSTFVKASIKFKKPKKGQPFTARTGKLQIGMKKISLADFALTGIPAQNVNSTNKKGDPASAEACVKLTNHQSYHHSPINGLFKGKKDKVAAFSAKFKIK